MMMLGLVSGRRAFSPVTIAPSVRLGADWAMSPVVSRLDWTPSIGHSVFNTTGIGDRHGNSGRQAPAWLLALAATWVSKRRVTVSRSGRHPCGRERHMPNVMQRIRVHRSVYST